MKYINILDKKNKNDTLRKEDVATTIIFTMQSIKYQITDFINIIN